MNPSSQTPWKGSPARAPTVRDPTCHHAIRTESREIGAINDFGASEQAALVRAIHTTLGNAGDATTEVRVISVSFPVLGAVTLSSRGSQSGSQGALPAADRLWDEGNANVRDALVRVSLRNFRVMSCPVTSPSSARRKQWQRQRGTGALHCGCGGSSRRPLTNMTVRFEVEAGGGPAAAAVVTALSPPSATAATSLVAELGKVGVVNISAAVDPETVQWVARPVVPCLDVDDTRRGRGRRVDYQCRRGGSQRERL